MGLCWACCWYFESVDFGLVGLLSACGFCKVVMLLWFVIADLVIAAILFILLLRFDCCVLGVWWLFLTCLLGFYFWFDLDLILNVIVVVFWVAYGVKI